MWSGSSHQWTRSGFYKPLPRRSGRKLDHKASSATVLTKKITEKYTEAGLQVSMCHIGAGKRTA